MALFVSSSRALIGFFSLVLACSESPCLTCHDPSDPSDVSELLQVKHAEHKDGDPSPGDPENLTFRVIPVNRIRDTFFKLRAKKNALAMGGGGTRAMAGTAGQMRALLSMGLLDEVDEVIAMSGSTWSTSIFAYSKVFTKEALLGPATYGALDQLTLDKLSVAANGGAILDRTTKEISGLVFGFAALGVPASKIFEYAIGALYFCAFGINGFIPGNVCPNGNENQVWTTSEERLEWIKHQNPHWNVSDALVSNGNLKSLLFVSTLLAPVGYNPSNDSIRGGAECVVILINNGYPIENKSTVDFCNETQTAAILQFPQQLLATSSGLGPQQSVYDYFGVAVPNLILKAGLDYANNQVFETSEMFSLYCEAQTKREAGEAVVVYRNYTTIKNKYWGIEAGKKVGVIFAWNEVTDNWKSELPSEVQDLIVNGTFDSPGGDPGNFPFVSTFFPAGNDYQKLLPEQAQLYASLQEWSLRQNQASLETCMGV